MPNSTAQRWVKEGMPVRREGRNVVASPEELNQWLQRTRRYFLVMTIRNMRIKCSLQSLDIFSLLRTVMRRCRTKKRLGT